MALQVQFRKLEKGDYDKGFIQLLSQFTITGKVSKEMFLNRFDEMYKYPFYSTWVSEQKGQIISTATLLIEDKFVHGCSRAAHIEDLAIDYAYRGKGIGTKLVEFLKEKAKAAGCYKILIDIKPEYKAFYEKLDMPRLGNEMRQYFHQ